MAAGSRAQVFAGQCTFCVFAACSSKKPHSICGEYKNGQFCVCALFPDFNEASCKYYKDALFTSETFVEKPCKRKRKETVKERNLENDES